jgi:hypothetical protein
MAEQQALASGYCTRFRTEGTGIQTLQRIFITDFL